MSLKTLCLAAIAALSLASPSFAEGTSKITVTDPYARASSAQAISGAAFMVLTNATETDDRLIAARSDVAERIELHTHVEDANGVMRMIEVKDGIAVPAQAQANLQRGGDHIMFMGLKEPMVQGDKINVTLVFEQAGEVEVEIPVDLERKPTHGGHGHGHGHKHDHNHGHKHNHTDG